MTIFLIPVDIIIFLNKPQVLPHFYQIIKTLIELIETLILNW